MTFDELQIEDQLLEAISYMRYEKASPIQELAIPAALAGKDILACAQTGTGKTASYVIPILNDLIKKPSSKTTSLILVPTRELAVQIHQEIQGFSYFANASSKAVYGGDKNLDISAQRQALREGTNIIVATPGRLKQFISQEDVTFPDLRHFILDEADRMLDMGFYEDVCRILCAIPDKRQTLMFSATMPPNISKLAKSILDHPERITLSLSKPAENVRQMVYVVHPTQKIGIIHHILESNPDFDSIIIFSSTKRFISKIVSSLQRKLDKGQVEGISSDFEQKEREQVLMRFRAKQTKILVATDVLSRGIDIKGVNLVINFDTPTDAEDYVHRVGRTARADAKGVAVTFVCDSELYKLTKIEKLIEREIEKIPVPELPKEHVHETRDRNDRRGNDHNRNRNRDREHGREHHREHDNNEAVAQQAVTHEHHDGHEGRKHPKQLIRKPKISPPHPDASNHGDI